MSIRGWISIATLLLVGLVLFFARGELQQAWQSLSQVNLWILALLIPAQILSYYAAGEMVFSYLRAKGSIKSVPKVSQVRMALELNFVNHALPSGGLSGLSYLTWRLGGYNVSPGRATMAQVVRYAMGLVAFMVLLVVSVLVVTIDGEINRWTILISSGLVTLMLFVVIVGGYMLASLDRLNKFSLWVAPATNKLIRRLTFGRIKKILVVDDVTRFFSEIHYDYRGLIRDRKVLKAPFIWGIIYTIADVSMFVIAFWALGHFINPAPVFIAYGVATVAGIIAITPGGAGAYEALMVMFLAVAGVASGVAIAGTVLARVIMMAGTIVLGYVFYQHAILRYGKGKSPIQRQ